MNLFFEKPKKTIAHHQQSKRSITSSHVIHEMIKFWLVGSCWKRLNPSKKSGCDRRRNWVDFGTQRQVNLLGKW